jgi:Flp pilus assembly protein TadB
MLISLRRRDRIVEQLVKSVADTEVRAGLGEPNVSDSVTGGQNLPLFIRKQTGVLAAIVSVSLLIGFMLGALKGVLGLILGTVFLIVRERRSQRQRQLSVDRDLPALLTSVASSVRAGIDPLVALSEAREFLPSDSVLAAELEQYHRSLTAGGDEDEIVDRLFRSVTTPDIELFKGCLRLSRKHGSSLAEPLHRVTRVVRQRQSFRRKTRAALAMHRMSAVGISLCAALIAVMQAVMNPNGIQLAISHSVGSKLLISGGALIAVGVVWMMSLGRDTSV